MVFKRLLGSLGMGGPTVDTVLSGSGTPGGAVDGTVHVQGGEAEFEIQQIVLELVATPAGPAPGGAGAPGGGLKAMGGMGAPGGGSGKPVVFGREVVGGGFRIAAGERRSLPFRLGLPWETPITELYGQPLGLELGVRTELAIAAARDSGDLDPLTVAALPAHETVLEALGQLGFGFAATTLVPGPTTGSPGQQLPFHQELMLSSPPQYTDRIQGLDLTLTTGPQGVDVVLEADKRLPGRPPGPAVRYTLPHQQAATGDWQSEIESWVEELLAQRQSAFGQPHLQGHPQQMPNQQGGPFQQQHMQQQHMHQQQMQQQGRRGGAGRAVAAGAAGVGAGLVGGMLLNEALSGDDPVDAATGAVEDLGADVSGLEEMGDMGDFGDFEE